MLPEKPLTSRNNWITDIVVLSTLFLIFYTFCLGSYPLFVPDEGRYAEVAREMVASGDYITPRVNGVAFLDKPALYYWIQAAAIHIFGINEWGLRLFPALFGILGCIVTYLCGRRLFDRRTGFISAIILATTPLYFSGAHYINLDLEVAVLISCTLLFFICGLQCTGKSRFYFLITAYLFAALAFLTKGLIGIAFPAMIGGAWIILLNKWKELLNIHLVKGLVLFIVITLPWYILVQKANPEFLHYFFVTQQVSRFLSSGEFNNPTPIWFYLPIVLIGFFPWSGFIIQVMGKNIRRIWQARHTYQTELFLLLWTIIVFVFFSIPRSKTITYILPIFPPLALLTGKYLSDMWNHAGQKSIFYSRIAIGITGILFAIALLSLSHYHWIDLSGKFKPYLICIAIACIIGTLMTLSLRKPKNLMPLFITLTAWSAIFLLILIMGVKFLNQSSTKPLAAELKKVIQPQDEVINYFKFYQDLPMYLERRITLVANWNSPDIPYNDNWVRELWYGMPFQNTEDWLINEDKFWERWNSDKRVFVFLNENYLDQFKAHVSKYYFLGSNKDIYLVSNKPAVSN